MEKMAGPAFHTPKRTGFLPHLIKPIYTLWSASAYRNHPTMVDLSFRNPAPRPSPVVRRVLESCENNVLIHPTWCIQLRTCEIWCFGLIAMHKDQKWTKNYARWGLGGRISVKRRG